MRAEPKPNPRRLKCIQCKERKPRTSPKATQIPNHTSLLLLDPFCSRTCAEDFHEVERRASSGMEMVSKNRDGKFEGVAA